MSLISQTSRSLKASQRLIFFAQKRFSVRQSIHRHVEPHKFKKNMLAACEPYIKNKYDLPEETCRGVEVTQHELLPLENILVGELLEDIDKSEFILFIQHNYTQFQSERLYKNTITKLGSKFHPLNNRIYKEAFKVLKLEAVDSLFITRNSLITGQVNDLHKCIFALKKMPQFLLLAGYVDKHLYNYNQLHSMTATTSIDDCRATLLSILETPAIDLSSNLERYGQTMEDDKQSDD